MTRGEMNSIIKQSITGQLAADKKLPEDLSGSYSAWVRSLINQAKAASAPRQPAEEDSGNEDKGGAE